MKTIGSMGLCPAGCYKLDPELKLACKLCRVSSHINQSLELTRQRWCNQKPRCCAVRATLKGPFSFLQILCLSLTWPLPGIYKMWRRLLLPFFLHTCAKDRDRPIQFTKHPGYKALSGNNTPDNLPSVCANKDLCKWASTVHHFGKWDSKKLGDFPWYWKLSSTDLDR